MVKKLSENIEFQDKELNTGIQNKYNLKFGRFKHEIYKKSILKSVCIEGEFHNIKCLKE